MRQERRQSCCNFPLTYRKIQQALGETQGVPGLPEVAEVLSGFLA
jgi:hypothetical protein